MSARITVTDEMIEKGREAREEHYLRVSPVSCTCGWRSDTYIEADGLPRFEAHLVELALEAAAPAIAAQALRDAADGYQTGGWADDLPTGGSRPALILGMSQRAVAWLRNRADRIEHDARCPHPKCPGGGLCCCLPEQGGQP